MPINYEVDLDTGIAIAKGHGTVTAKNIINLLKEYTEDTRLSRPHKELFDTTAINHYEIFSSDLEQIMDFLITTGNRFSKGKIAHVVDTDVAFGIGRMFEAAVYTYDVELMVFWDIKKACEWLGISDKSILNIGEFKYI